MSHGITEITVFSVVTRLRTGSPEDRRLIPCKQTFFILFTSYRPVLEPTQPPIQCVSGLFIRSCSGRGVNPTTQLHLVSRFKISGDIPPLSHMSSWRGAELSTGTILLYFYLYCDVLSVPNNQCITSNFVANLPLKHFASVSDN
jgi:hypothetical protein